MLLHDPQTSGGLLFAAAAAQADAIEHAFGETGEPLFRIGEAVAGGRPGGIELI